MKKILLPVCLLLMISCGENKSDNHSSDQNSNEQTTNQATDMKTIYDFKVKDIDGDEFDFASLKGKKIMVVNTASECGYTPQYAPLELLYQEYKDKNFTIVAFPSNDFGAQEPGSDEEIKSFCTKNFGVTFPLMSKISVKGEEMHPVYKFLTSKSENGVEDVEVKWNFQKFLIDENGHYVKTISHKTEPMDSSIVNWITQTKLDL